MMLGSKRSTCARRARAGLGGLLVVMGAAATSSARGRDDVTHEVPDGTHPPETWRVQLPGTIVALTRGWTSR